VRGAKVGARRAPAVVREKRSVGEGKGAGTGEARESKIEAPGQARDEARLPGRRSKGALTWRRTRWPGVRAASSLGSIGRRWRGRGPPEPGLGGEPRFGVGERLHRRCRCGGAGKPITHTRGAQGGHGARGARGVEGTARRRDHPQGRVGSSGAGVGRGREASTAEPGAGQGVTPGGQGRRHSATELRREPAASGDAERAGPADAVRHATGILDLPGVGRPKAAMAECAAGQANPRRREASQPRQRAGGTRPARKRPGHGPPWDDE